MREHLEREISRLKRQVGSLAAAVENAVAQAVQAAGEGNSELAAAVIERDNLIDHNEIILEEECLKILALHQPVAGDLRYIITFLKVNGELERIGDLAVNIAKCAMELAALREEPPEGIDFRVLTTRVREMLKRALDALLTRNCLEANEALKMDEEVDRMNRENFETITGLIRKYPRFASSYVHTLFISRHLERIGDCTTNICEDVIYLELGKIVRHGGLPE